jgi:hypothetical protein
VDHGHQGLSEADAVFGQILECDLRVIDSPDLSGASEPVGSYVTRRHVRPSAPNISSSNPQCTYAGGAPVRTNR